MHTVWRPRLSVVVSFTKQKLEGDRGLGPEVPDVQELRYPAGQTLQQQGQTEVVDQNWRKVKAPWPPSSLRGDLRVFVWATKQCASAAGKHELEGHAKADES